MLFVFSLFTKSVIADDLAGTSASSLFFFLRVAPVTSFSFPYDITKEGSTLYLSNTGFNQFIKIDPSSGKIESLFSETKDILITQFE